MSEIDRIPASAWLLMNQFVDGGISDDDMARLERTLSESAAARELLVELCQFHALLEVSVRTDRLIETVASRRAAAPQTVAGADVPAQRKPASMARREPPRTSAIAAFLGDGPRIALWTTAAATVALIWAVGHQRRAPQPPRQPPVEQTAEQPAAARRPELATIRMQSGAAKVSLGALGSITVEGPVDLEMLGERRARLNQGKIRMRVVDQAGEPFVVETPHGEIVEQTSELAIDVEARFTGVVVFDGDADVRTPSVAHRVNNALHTQRLSAGDGVVLGTGGRLDRIMSIVSGPATFAHNYAARKGLDAPLIVDVTDNLAASDTRKFYEIVPGGLAEDAPAYVDRLNHDWNGMTQQGMPPYLIGADYVKPFNDDRVYAEMQITVTLARPARLFVFFDDRVATPEWLERDFVDTGDDIGIDMGVHFRDGKRLVDAPRGEGPGNSVEARMSVWERRLPEGGSVTLGSNHSQKLGTTTMYGIASLPLEGGPSY